MHCLFVGPNLLPQISQISMIVDDRRILTNRN